MPRGKKTNKSQAIRDLLTAKPEMTVKEVLAALSTRGLKVTDNLVYFIKQDESEDAAAQTGCAGGPRCEHKRRPGGSDSGSESTGGQIRRHRQAEGIGRGFDRVGRSRFLDNRFSLLPSDWSVGHRMRVVVDRILAITSEAL